jgi:glycosyltransferase involved in cell wall biosynthesis
MSMSKRADVCIIVEGSYPYVAGGVSTWVHDLIRAQSHLSFHILALKADDTPVPLKFTLPDNVIGISEIALQRAENHVPSGRSAEAIVRDIEPALARLLHRGTRADYLAMLEPLRRQPGKVSRSDLLNSEPAFEMLQRIYDSSVPGSSFLRYFWSWRSLVGSLFAVSLAELPAASVYHAVSTGFAGLAMARAVLETGRPGLLTEHGIYTNERRIEIAMAQWLTEGESESLNIDRRHRDLRDFWLDAFESCSTVCYQCSDRIITLYLGNQLLQARDGAPADRMTIIPNGVDVDLYAAVERSTLVRPPTVAMIGRVVPIKDVKTFIRAVAMLRDLVPGVRALMLGPTDEDPDYFVQCNEMVAHLGLTDSFTFMGRVKLTDHLGGVDAIVLTSLSEAQPLVLLEAGAAGVPCVATDVGSCRDIIEGHSDEDPALGHGGFVTPLANPRATAQALADLLLDKALHERCANAMRERTRIHYSKAKVDQSYRALYEQHLAAPDKSTTASAVGA